MRLPLFFCISLLWYPCRSASIGTTEVHSDKFNDLDKEQDGNRNHDIIYGTEQMTSLSFLRHQQLDSGSNAHPSSSGGNVKMDDKYFNKNSRNLQSTDLQRSKDIANITYQKVLPCMNQAWMMEGWGVGDKWAYPDDAEAHFKNLTEMSAEFRTAPIHSYAGYGDVSALGKVHTLDLLFIQGSRCPWIENLFISQFMSKPLSFYNGLIPLFIQWIDTDINSKSRFVAINNFLKRELRPNVLYIAISQGDIGLGRAGTDHPNILVLSSGGYGHIPLPLIKGDMAYHEPPASYRRDIGFFGSMTTGSGSRKHALELLKKSFEDRHMTVKYYQGHAWAEEMLQTKINIAPRGYGRNSFRFSESIQMGRIPFFVFDDIPWLPYENTDISIHTYGFSGGTSQAANHTSLEDTALLISNMTDAVYKGKVEQLKKIRKYFTYSGVFEQIEMFLGDPFGVNGGHLRCIKHPKTERCCGR